MEKHSKRNVLCIGDNTYIDVDLSGNQLTTLDNFAFLLFFLPSLLFSWLSEKNILDLFD